MKKIILVILLIFTLSFTISAEINPVLRFIFESAIETDRRQTYEWLEYNEENPRFTPNGYAIGEKNIFVIGMDIKTFDKTIDNTKKAVNVLPRIIDCELTANQIYGLIALAELAVAINNNQMNKKYGLPQTWTISYSWEF